MRSRHPPVWATLVIFAIAALVTSQSPILDAQQPEQGTIRAAPPKAPAASAADSVVYEICVKVSKVEMDRSSLSMLAWIELDDGRKSVRPTNVGLTPIYPGRHYIFAYSKAGYARATPTRDCGAKDLRATERRA